MVTKGTSSNRVAEAYKAVSRHVVSGARGRAPSWPFSILETTIFYSKFFTRELLDTMRKLEKKEVKQEDIAKMFCGPSAVSHWLYLAGFAFEGLDQDEVVEFIERTIQIMESLRKKDPFCINWKNIIWDISKVKKECNRNGFIESKQTHIPQIIGKINTIAWHYCILIQVGHRNYSHEFHGPYDLGNGEQLFVREYFNLKPKEIWPFANAKNIPFEKMTILEVYRDVEIKVDMFNHLWASASLPNHLQRVLITLDDSKVLTEEEAKQLLVKWVDIITKANNYVKDYTKEDWARKVIEMKYWLLKTHRDILGENWRAPKEVVDLAARYKDIEETAKRAIHGQIKRIRGYPEEQAMRNITQMYLDNIYKGMMYF